MEFKIYKYGLSMGHLKGSIFALNYWVTSDWRGFSPRHLTASATLSLGICPVLSQKSRNTSWIWIKWYPLTFLHWTNLGYGHFLWTVLTKKSYLWNSYHRVWHFKQVTKQQEPESMKTPVYVIRSKAVGYSWFIGTIQHLLSVQYRIW